MNSILRNYVLFTSFFHRHHTTKYGNKLAPTHDIFRAIEKSMLEILISCDFVNRFLQGALQVSGGFRRGDS